MSYIQLIELGFTAASLMSLPRDLLLAASLVLLPRVYHYKQKSCDSKRKIVVLT